VGGSALAGAYVGAFSGAVMGGEGNRMSGAAWGAGGGFLGGSAMRGLARNGANWSNRASKSFLSATDSRMMSAIGMTPTPNARRNMLALRGSGDPNAVKYMENRDKLRGAIAGFHSKKNRNAMFRSGALLGGGVFGAMFAGSGKTHKRGFNSNRGNSFGR